jgi:predicted RNase H-like nuclease (RuvC/YqgF family)
MPNNKIILKKLTILDTIWHPETKLVFKSRTDKIVTGMYINNEFVHLDDTAIELCEKWGFIMDESLFETVDENTNKVFEPKEDINKAVESNQEDISSVVELNEEKDIMNVVESTEGEISNIDSDKEEISNVQEEVVTNNLETLDSKLCCVVKTLSDVISQIKQAHDLELSNSKIEIVKLKEDLLRMTDERDKLASKFSALKGLLG